MAYQQNVETYQDGTRSGTETRTVQTTPEHDSEATLRDRARQALDTNRTYIALGSPTAAQTTAQVKALSRQNVGLIRLALALLDGTD